jgi:hypothetical protein
MRFTLGKGARLGGRLLSLRPGSGFRRGALLRLLRLGPGSGFRGGALLRLLRLGPGSGFRRGALLQGRMLPSLQRNEIGTSEFDPFRSSIPSPWSPL